jgi:pimeloyl-ACP methyl ester carboxylesterase
VRSIRELVPALRVVLLEEVGHYPQLEAPGQVLDAYFAFRDELA